VCYEVRIAVEAVDFSLLRLVQIGSATNVTSCSMGTSVSFLAPRIKRPGLDVDHPPPSRAKVWNV
jgi:hypothetical protein